MFFMKILSLALNNFLLLMALKQTLKKSSRIYMLILKESC